MSTADSATKRAQGREEDWKGNNVKAIIIDIDHQCKAIPKFDSTIPTIILKQSWSIP
jgi:hypothetical protein